MRGCTDTASPRLGWCSVCLAVTALVFILVVAVCRAERSDVISTREARGNTEV
jgi:hypothetical protein